jgi:hypothetical protein
MTISCPCPKCGRICGFKDVYAGRRARCLSCQTRFIIPAADGEPAGGVPEQPGEPLPGFYRAVLKDNIRGFFQRESLFGIIICITLTAFHFFLGDQDYSVSLPGFRLPGFVGWIVTGITGGYLLWYYMETINESAFGCDSLADIFSGGGFAFIGEAVKSVYFFAVAFVIALVPAFVVINVLNFIGIAWAPIEIAVVVICLAGVPLLLAMLALGIAPWMLFRFDRIAVIIAKTFWPYCLTAAVTLAALLLIGVTVGLFAADEAAPPAALMLAARILAVFAGLLAMRTIGLYARHYFPQFPELKVPEY